MIIGTPLFPVFFETALRELVVSFVIKACKHNCQASHWHIPLAGLQHYSHVLRFWSCTSHQNIPICRPGRYGEIFHGGPEKDNIISQRHILGLCRTKRQSEEDRTSCQSTPPCSCLRSETTCYLAARSLHMCWTLPWACGASTYLVVKWQINQEPCCWAEQKWLYIFDM